MKTYSITYDLDNPSRNYQGVIKRIKELANGYCHPTQSQWLINSDLSASQIRDVVGKELDSGDKLLVHEVGNLWAARGLTDETNNWLYNYWHSSCPVS